MFRLAVVSCAIIAAFSMPIRENLNVRDRAYYEEKFIDWVAQHNVKIEDGNHFVRMLQNFANNDDIIEAHNAKGESFTLGHNQFSHMSIDEWRDYVNMGVQTRPKEEEPAAFIHQAPADPSVLASSIDWVSKGAVTPVKDQGQCGSCWSFATTGSLEGAYFNKFGKLNSYSEQNFVDCDGLDSACNGGWMTRSYTWAKFNGGVCSEAAYPYVSGTTKTAGTCKQDKCIDANVRPTSYTEVAKNSDAAMMSALDKQPVAVAIKADDSTFQLYKSGVYTTPCGNTLNHGVLVVGYGADYWKVKNSWGASWGDNGYILLARGASYEANGGQCGVLSGPPVYPNL